MNGLHRLMPASSRWSGSADFRHKAATRQGVEGVIVAFGDHAELRRAAHDLRLI